MKQGYQVEYSDDLNEVCLIPQPSIDVEEFCDLTRLYIKQGYKCWLPADDRRGYLYCKEVELYYKKHPNLNLTRVKEVSKEVLFTRVT